MSSETTIVAEQCRLQEWSAQIRDCQSRPAGMSVMSSLKTWESRFGCNVQFIDSQYSGYFLYSTFSYFCREILK